MNEYNDPNAAFDGIVNNSFQTNPQVTPAQPYTDPHPYGPPATPAKTGLTPRGKAALAIAATVVAGGSLLGWQHYAAAQAANQVKAQELQIEQQKLAFEQQKALDKATQSAQKTQSAAEKTRQAKVDACVQDNKDLAGKQMGYTLHNVVEDCQAQYPDSVGTGQDMQEAATASTASGGVNDFVLIGGGTLALGVIVAVKKLSKPAQPAPVIYRPY